VPAAKLYAHMGKPLTAFFMTSDAAGNLITNVDDYACNHSDSLAVFPQGSHAPNLFYPITDGQYLGVAVGTHQTELFALKDYPSTAVGVYSYDESTGTIGSLLRSFPAWYYNQSIAVFSP
jgi:hypothetical protein